MVLLKRSFDDCKDIVRLVQKTFCESTSYSLFFLDYLAKAGRSLVILETIDPQLNQSQSNCFQLWLDGPPIECTI